MRQFLQFVFSCLLTSAVFNVSAQRTLTGRVVDEFDNGLVGATVKTLPGGGGVITGSGGAFEIRNLPIGTDRLEVSYTGFKTEEVFIGNSPEIVIHLTSESNSLDEIIISTGSRNQERTIVTTLSAIDIYNLATLAGSTAQVDVNQILTYLSPSFQSARQAIADGTDHVDPAQLRGLGPDQVLVLINGKRRHQSALVNVNGTVNRGTVGTDMSAIPIAAIDHIEVLRDGAAAQYGSDAIAGVINIILKDQTKGAADGSLSYGLHATEYDKNYALAQTNSAQKITDNANDGSIVQASVNYGTKLGREGSLNLTAEYISREATNRAGTYTGQIYPKNGAGQVVDDSIMMGRRLDREYFDMRIGNSELQGGGVMYNLKLPIGNNDWEAYSFGGINTKKGNAAGFYRYPDAINTGAKKYADEVLAYYRDGFLPEINTRNTDFSVALGAKGHWGDWEVDFSNTLGQNKLDFSVANSVNYTQVAINPITFQTEFEAGGLKFLQNTVNLDLSRRAGENNIAFGVEYRIDQFAVEAGEEASYLNYDTASQAASGAQVFAGFRPENADSRSRNCLGVYGDLERDFFNNRLAIGAAARFENYSDFGSTLNGKLSARYFFDDDRRLAVRSTLSTGFRAPSMQQQYYARTSTLFVPKTGVGLVPVESGTFTNESAPARILGIPKLEEETSLNFSLGLTAQPLNGLKFSLDAYQIDINNRIVLTNNFSSGGDSLLKAQLDAAGAGLANFFANAVDTRARGLEAVVDYKYKIGGNKKHTMRFTVAGAFTKNEVKKGSDGNPDIHASPKLESTGQVGQYFNREDQSRIEVANPRSKVTATLNYTNKNFTAMLRAVRFGQVVYIDPIIKPLDSLTFPINTFSGKRETLDQTFKAKIVMDASVSYRINSVTLTVGGSNLFDVYPDRQEHSFNMSSGRFVYSRRVQQFGFNGRYVFGRISFNIRK